MGYSYKTLGKKINESSVRMNIASQGKHDYAKAIEALSATQQVCKHTIQFLKKCQADNIPFDEYEITLKKNINKGS